ncbi:MAG: hypothetical protein ABTQ31_04560 [Rhizobiaceae bacterium]
MQDKYFVYRPLLDLIGFTEGADKGRGYNETLAYGAFTGGDVDLVSMTLTSIEALQARMLKHPDNRWNSSAVGRYQIVGKTLRGIRQTLNLPGALKFDADCQDRMACFLLGQRGIDKYLAGRLRENTLIDNLAQEWASLPTTAGKSYYGGQNAAVTPARVRGVLAKVRDRHREGQPKDVVKEPVVPVEVVKEAEKQEKRKWWEWLIAAPATGLIGWFRDNPDIVLLLIGIVLIVAVVSLLGGRQLVRRVKSIRDEWKAA